MADDSITDAPVGENPTQRTDGPPPATLTWKIPQDQFRRLAHTGEFAVAPPPPVPDPVPEATPQPATSRRPPPPPKAPAP